MGGKKKPPAPPPSAVSTASRGTADRVGKIRSLAEKRKGSFNPVGDLDQSSNRGTLFEWMGSEEWMHDLRREGYTDFYARRVQRGPRKGELPRGAREFGSDEFGKVLSKTFPRGGPDIVAVDPKGKRILVGDITAGEWSAATVRIPPGEMHRHPAELRKEVEEVHHLVKTQRDAQRLNAALPDSHKDFDVAFQDRYRESERKASKRVQVKRKTQATGAEARLTRTAEAQVGHGLEEAGRSEREIASATRTAETDVSRGLEAAPRLETHAVSSVPSARKVVSTLEHEGGTLLRVGRSGFKVRSLLIGVKAWRAVRTVGKILITCFVPLKVLDVVLEVALRIWDREREKEEKKRLEKQHALEAVFREGGNWIEEAMGKKPPTSLSQLIERNILDNTHVQEQFMKDWDGNRNFNGFQYARLSAIVRIETYQDMRGEDDESLRYYSVESREVYAANVGRPFELEDIGEPQEVEKTDEESLRLMKENGIYAGNLRKMVMRKRLRYTIVPPLLAPYDIVVTKMNNLFIDIVQFAAVYTGAGGEIFTKPFAFTYRYPEWQTQFTVLPDFYQAPLNGAVCEYCLGYLYYAAKLLSHHPLEQQDLEGRLEDPQKGWLRRFWLLKSVIDGTNTAHGKNYSYFAGQVKSLVRPGQKDVEVVAALNELYTGARAIWYDLERIERNLKQAEYYYLGPELKQAE
jgi:hypothetical protein